MPLLFRSISSNCLILVFSGAFNLHANTSGVLVPSEIQGAGVISPCDGEVVTVRGIVTGDFQESDELGGFFLQNENPDGDPATSDGIFVSHGSAQDDVQPGDDVELTGTVDEINDCTRVVSVASFSVHSSGNDLPQPVIVNLPESVDGELERYEGMRIQINVIMTVTSNFYVGRYGQLALSSPDDDGVPGRLFHITDRFLPESPEANDLEDENARRLLILDDGQDINALGDNPEPVPFLGSPPPDVIRPGDRVSYLAGFLDEGRIDSGNSNPETGYRLHPETAPAFSVGNARMASPPDVGGTLKVASFNLLNYFNGNGTGGGFPTSRGADTSVEFIRQRAKILAAILAMEADIVGLIEIENDGYGANSAIQDIVDGLNAMAGAGTYDFVDPGTADFGGDGITLGLLYRPAKVGIAPGTTVEALFTGEFNQSPARHRQPMAVTFEELVSGEIFTVAVNHFRSKNGSTGHPLDDDQGDGQGGNNFSRTNAAMELTDWLATDPTGSGDPDFLIIGDLNSYSREDPLESLKSDGYTDLIEQSGAGERYSLSFENRSGSLDHALATASLSTRVTGAAEWHINSDEPPLIDYNQEFNPPGYYNADPFRSSDHDPVVIGLLLAPVYQPDVILSGTGQDVYDESGAGQSITFVSRRGKPVFATIVVENDGSDEDEFHVRGSRGNRFFRTIYRAPSNVTAPVLAGIYSTGALEPGQTKAVHLRVKPNRPLLRKKIRKGKRRKTKWLRKSIVLFQTATSQVENGKVDSVLLRLKHR